jgi:hypothetical protein
LPKKLVVALRVCLDSCDPIYDFLGKKIYAVQELFTIAFSCKEATKSVNVATEAAGLNLCSGRSFGFLFLLIAYKPCESPLDLPQKLRNSPYIVTETIKFDVCYLRSYRFIFLLPYQSILPNLLTAIHSNYCSDACYSQSLSVTWGKTFPTYPFVSRALPLTTNEAGCIETLITIGDKDAERESKSEFHVTYFQVENEQP